jgi:hypothetical protein
MKASLERSTLIAGQHPAIPKAKRAAVRLWGYVAVGAAFAGIAYAFLGGWYWAVIGAAAMLVIGLANRRTAAETVLEAARENPAFKAEMISAGVIIDK